MHQSCCLPHSLAFSSLILSDLCYGIFVSLQYLKHSLTSASTTGNTDAVLTRNSGKTV